MGDGERDVFSVRIVSIDYYTTPPIPDLDVCYSNFHGGKVNQVPVIRIYGSTPAGQKTCLHVHRVLPYLYIPCADLGPITNAEAESLKHTICLALEKSLKFKGNAGSKRQHIHGCDLVPAKKFYGYHSSEELFMKIYFYHPQDISRASSFLLAGAILEKILQPYESHIPFLLQFLIDYNLYGMGHLHVSKVKFRLPMPDVFPQRNLKYNGESRPAPDKSTDPSGSLCTNIPIWTSSTIPDGWSWPPLYHSTEQENSFFRRQSTCELEGDAIVDDIMNRKLISTVSLSQTDSDVKMVQSLIPIWKEEYERSGIFDAMPLDSKKPSPQDVLRVLSFGVDLENIVEQKDYAEGCSLLTPEIDHGKLIDASLQRISALENSGIDAPIASQIPGSLSPSSAKAPDEDALRLLNWLASSEAAEDINSDDELARDTILSPLLPSKDINKVLERASVDYESESQKECQDILDSVDLQTLEESNTRNDIPSEHNNQSANKSSLTKIIPQLDGSNDDLLLTPCSKSSSETGDGDTVFHEESSKLLGDTVSNHRKEKPGWGPLPLSCKTTDRLIDCHEVDQYRNKKKCPANLAGSEGISLHIVNSNEKYNVNRREEDPAISEFSTRDMMRRKRSLRAELTNCRSPEEDCKTEIQLDIPCEKRDQYFDPISENDMTPTKAFVSAVHNSPVENDGTRCDEMNMCSTVDMFVEDCNVESTSSRKDCMKTNNPDNLLQVGSLCQDTCDTSEKAKKDEKTLEVIAMPCFRGLPKIDCTDEPYCEAPLLPEKERNNDMGLTHDGRFPKKDETEGGNFEQSVRASENTVSQAVVYQKDGSCLFMLTPALLPPSRESVDKWLSFASSVNTIESENSREVTGRPTQESALSDEQNDLIQQPGHSESCCDMEVRPLKETKKNESAGDYSQVTSQISGPEGRTRQTPFSQTGFRDPASTGQGQQLTLLSIEVQAESRGDLRPDPRFDAVNIIVLVFQEDDESILDSYVLLCCKSDHVSKNLDAVSGCKIFVCTEELEMFGHFIKVICASDPDVVMGWDVQSGSIGFLAERAAYLGLSLLNSISRTPSKVAVSSGDSRAYNNEMVKEMAPASVAVESVGIETTVIEDEWGRTHASGVHVGGRIVLNVWRLMRNEVRISMYTIEAVAEAVLRRKVPYIPWKVLRQWFSSGPGKARYRSIHYTLERAKLNLQIMSKLDMVNRTSELARVFGIDFFSVLSRGSQYRVESMFLRLAHMQSYLAISPGNQQVANQPAMECLPLVMEPESGFYRDPVIVLDFQSLYPSMVIAYNLCYCTCLGNITPSKADTLGVVTPFEPDRKILHDLRHRLLVTPNGVVYLPSTVRKGILPRLLEEILSTRIMVKQAMKRLSSSQTVLHRILNSRQLALKLIANVTYGYTAAGFSGRMPCAELADSIVQCGRRTLEAAISFVNTNDKWKARVVYGDTDSMFVLLKGRSLKEAFEIGREIAASITAMNPDPVTLKMEKVYYPCFLLTKKRYVGYSYESPDQKMPTFDAKGIETVRRDTCGAVSKIMEKSLRTFFESKSTDEVKTFVLRQWTKILSGRISIQDFVFAKEVRLGTYSEQAHSLPPAAIVATKSMRLDPRAEPRYAERVPYVVVHGEPGARLADMVVDPHELVSLNSPFRLNDIYYIRKQIIPALQRVFGLVGSDLNQWFLEMPKPGRESFAKRNSLAADGQKKTRIDYYYLSKNCVVCGELVEGSSHLCGKCCKNEALAAVVLTGRASKLEREIQHISAICGNCGGGDWIIESGVKCTSLACSVFYERVKVQKELQSVSEVASSLGYYPKCMAEWF